jgi:putative transposase
VGGSTEAIQCRAEDESGLRKPFCGALMAQCQNEEVYLNDYQSVAEAVSNLRAYFTFYNHERRHQALDYQTSAQVYLSR